MSFEEKLNTIIFKYNVDAACSDYRKYVKAVELAQILYSSIRNHTEKVVLLGIDQMDISFFKSLIRDNESITSKLYQEADSIQAGGVTVLLVSYYQKDQMIVDLRERNIYVISLYDHFESNGLVFNHNYYDIYNDQYWDGRQEKWVYEYGNIDINQIYYFHRRRYETAQEESEKRLYLEKMIFDCVYAKDFLTMRENIDKYSLEFREQSEKYFLFAQEIESLLLELKNTLAKRNAEDVIVFWLDMLEYGMDKTMPFLKGLDRKALVFEKAFTVTPYTSPTLVTLLTGKCQIEDDTYILSRIDSDDNILAKELQERNYVFKYYGNHLNHWLEQNDLSDHVYRSDLYSFTQLYWDALTDLADEAEKGKKGFSILHELSHTHWPLVSLGVKSTNYITDYRNEKIAKQVWSKQSKDRQQMESRKYVDRQLEFWSDLLPDSMYKIYMSDHGMSFLGKFHIIMKIQQKNIMPHIWNGLFSYKNFLPMILQLIDNHMIDEKSLSSPYAVIQEVAWYNRERVFEVIKAKDYYSTNLDYVGFQGVVTEEDMLVSYDNGFEYYQKHQNDHKMVSDNRLNYLRKLISQKKADYFHVDKFQYTRILIMAEKKRAERTKEFHKRKCEVINNIFEQIKETEILALRGGGYHTLNLLMPLEERLRNKVKYIIDSNKECVGGKMGIEVITLVEMMQKGVTTVLISSYQYLQKWEEELKSYTGIRTINIYQILKKSGLPCDMEACFERFMEEDFDMNRIVD